MKANEKLTWTALEYEEKERSKDWFWALGVIVVTSAIAAMIFADYFFAALLILAGILLGLFAIKKPDIMEYELTDRGLRIHTRFYPYENIRAFWVQSHDPLEINREVFKKPMLFIRSERFFMPIISIPIDEEIGERIYSIMLEQNILEEEMKEHPSEKIMEALGF
ncbi:MAG TPA: hypothetical protein VJH06_01280 [Candidatus Paceibacterota bacterium]